MTLPRAPFDRSVDLLDKNVLMARAALAMVIGGPVMLVAAAAGVFPPGVLGFHAFVMGVLGSIACAWKNPRPKRRRARVHADGEGVRVDGALVVPRAKIADGFFQPRAGRDPNKERSFGSSVRLVDKRRRIIFEAEADEREALELLWALGLDPGSKRVEFNASSPMFATLGRNIGFVAGSIAILVTLSFASAALGLNAAGGILPLLVFAWFLGGMLPSKISVGIDGVHLRWLWRKELVPMATIASIERVADREILLRLTDGSEKRLYTSMRSRYRMTTAYATQHCDAVIARIREAHWAFRSRTPAADISALVARGTRSREEWRQSLAKLRDAEGGYREASLREDDLWRVVEDPSAPEDARGAAAMLLRRSLDDEGKARVRVAAEATASPKLRVALDAAADDTEEKLESALDELAGDDAPAEGRA